MPHDEKIPYAMPVNVGRSSLTPVGIFLMWLCLASACITPFEPAYRMESNDILVVEGMILEGSATVIKLSRSKVINSEEDEYRYVEDAAVSISCSDGTDIPLRWNGVKGQYVPVSEVHFHDGLTYTVEIAAGDKQYRSEALVPLQTPPIDEVSYITGNDGTQVDLRVSTHDATGKTKYYRWAYEEDWEVKMDMFVTLRYDPETNSIITGMNRETSNNTYYCWGKETSTSLLLGDATQIAGGIIKDQVLLQRKVTARDSRFSYLYCFTVRQYAIGEDAHAYFRNLKRNTEETASVFAPIPSEMQGNLHCTSHPEEPVVGFLIAATEASSRLYIPAEDVTKMSYPETCGAFGPYPASESRLHYGNRRIWKEDIAGWYIWTNTRCVDCTKHNLATKTKPDFWPNNHL